MFEFATEALKAFSSFPVAQAFLVLLILLIGVMVFRKGERDRKTGTNGNGMPSWLLYGPVKDVMADVRDMAEQSRVTNRLLDRLAENGARLVESNNQREREQREQTQVLEDIRNNQVMRMETTTAHPMQPKPRRNNP